MQNGKKLTKCSIKILNLTKILKIFRQNVDKCKKMC